MEQVNMHEAKTRLSKLVDDIESGRESQIIIAWNGKPVAQMTAFSKSKKVDKRIGVARGKFTIPEPSEELEEIVADLFGGGEKSWISLWIPILLSGL